MTKLHKTQLRKLQSDEQGNIAMLFALMLIPMFGMMGEAIDYARLYYAKTELQTAADAAALAAIRAANKTEAERTTIATTTFKTNYRPDNPSSAPTPTVTITGGQVKVQAQHSVETTMMALLGSDATTVEVESSAEANNAGKKVEVSMMIDLTGSMGTTRGGMTKIAALKLAGQDFLNILYPNGDDANVKVAVAPFADYVNAGPYAAAATGLPSTGFYNNQYNLASTKQGPYSGTYSGYTGSSGGSQHGSTSASSTQAGATFDNQYCANPTYVTQQTQVVYRNGRINYTWYNWPVAASYSSRNFTGASYGYFWVENYQGYPGNWAYGQMYYTPKTTVTSTTNVVAGCESGNTNSGSLVTCVTERTDSNHRYDDESPATGGYVGAYNLSASGVTNKLNYSSDGKCYTAGRELPKVIPLTTSKSTISDFFQNATIGGGTPGHLGTAWAWYLLSPNWSSIWPSSSTPAAYTDNGTKKYAVLMTDGEYNMQYSSETSRTQALALCTAMKAKGIKVYTIGFGFSTSSVAGSSTAEGKAKEMLQNCASDSSSYFFPYDSDALRQVFQSIGNSVMDGDASETMKITQ